MKPVTRAELREELKPLKEDLQRTEDTLRDFAIRLNQETRDDMARQFAELRAEIALQFADVVRQADLARQFGAMKEFIKELFKGSQEANASASELKAVDDKYSDLPPRVANLERAVFPPKRQRRR